MKTRDELFWEWKCLKWELNAHENILNAIVNEEDDIPELGRNFKEFKEYFNDFIDRNPELDLSGCKLL